MQVRWPESSPTSGYFPRAAAPVPVRFRWALNKVRCPGPGPGPCPRVDLFRGRCQAYKSASHIDRIPPCTTFIQLALLHDCLEGGKRDEISVDASHSQEPCMQALTKRIRTVVRTLRYCGVLDGKRRAKPCCGGSEERAERGFAALVSKSERPRSTAGLVLAPSTPESRRCECLGTIPRDTESRDRLGCIGGHRARSPLFALRPNSLLKE